MFILLIIPFFTTVVHGGFLKQILWPDVLLNAIQQTHEWEGASALRRWLRWFGHAEWWWSNIVWLWSTWNKTEEDLVWLCQGDVNSLGLPQEDAQPKNKLKGKIKAQPAELT